MDFLFHKIDNFFEKTNINFQIYLDPPNSKHRYSILYPTFNKLLEVYTHCQYPHRLHPMRGEKITFKKHNF